MTRKIIFLILLVTSLPYGLRAEILGTAEFSAEFGFCNTTTWPRMFLRIQIAQQCPDLGLCAICSIPFYTWLDSTEVDTVLIATNETLDFSCVVNHLTNNYSEYVGVAFYRPSRVSGYGGPVSYGIENELFSLDSLDFYGADITAISLRLDELNYNIDYGSPCEFGYGYCRVTMIIEGTWDNVAVETTSWGYIKSMYSK